MPEIIFEKRDHVAWVTINRPAKKNTLNAAVFVELAAAWQEVRDDDNVWTAVLSGSGEEDFCCGGDLKEVMRLWLGQKEPENAIERAILADPLIADKVLLKDQPLYKPVISAINGRALGGGCELMQATDYRLAAEHATFGLPEPKVGLIPGGGSTVRLARQIPWAHAMRIFLGGKPIEADEALRMGLISEIVPAAQLQVRTAEVAEAICAQAPLALQAIKRAALETQAMDWQQAFAFERQESTAISASRDAREGNRAFSEKRKPVFTAN